MENKQITFNINGCCVLRDIFGIREDEDASNYKVNHFRQFSSPITWFIMNDKPLENISLDDLKNLNVDSVIKDNFTKKCIVDDYNKSVLESYDGKSDFFLLDFAEARYGIINVTSSDGQKHYFTATGRMLKKNKDGFCFLDLLEGEKIIESFEKFDSPYNVNKTCELYADWLINKMGYQESEIILVETKNALSYTDGKYIYDFPNKEKIISENNYIEKWNNEFKKFLPGCNVIKMPADTIADTRNKWGLLPLHFSREVYDYLYEAITVIVKKDNFNAVEYYRNRCSSLMREKIAYYSINKELEIMQVLKENTSKGLDLALGRIENITNCKLSDIRGYIVDIKSDVEKEINCPHVVLDYHVSTEGWLQKSGREIICTGIKNSNLQIEAIKLKVSSSKTHVNYAVRLKNRPNFTNVYADGKMSGTTGRSIPLIGIKIWLTGEGAKDYSISYEISGENEIRIGKDGDEVSLQKEVIKRICIKILSKTIGNCETR